MLTIDALRENLSSRDWRLSNLYYIKNEGGKKVLFKLNDAQQQLLDDLHNQNIILKARQLGFTTLIQILMLDAALWNDNTSCGVVAQTLDDAKSFFEDKIKFAYDNLPRLIRDRITSSTDNVREMKFNNGSRVVVGVSLRSGTFQWLHISEYGKVCAKYPEKAKEIRTGALNTVHSDQRLFIESTAEGQDGDFYDMCKTAMEHDGELTVMDKKFHFFPWYQDKRYTLDGSEDDLTQATLEYFSGLSKETGYAFSVGQMLWYQKKAIDQRSEMKREFPSTPREAFEASVIGALWTPDMIEACRVKHGPDHYERIVVAVDPPATKGGDECGIVVAGIYGGRAYVIEDASEGGLSPAQWAGKAIALYHSYHADRVIIETNMGGDMAENTLTQIEPFLPIRRVHAAKGKVTRAEPISALYEQGKVSHVGGFHELEKQMTTYVGVGGSPDRYDAVVYAITDLMLGDNYSLDNL